MMTRARDAARKAALATLARQIQQNDASNGDGHGERRGEDGDGWERQAGRGWQRKTGGREGKGRGEDESGRGGAKGRDRNTGDSVVESRNKLERSNWVAVDVNEGKWTADDSQDRMHDDERAEALGDGVEVGSKASVMDDDIVSKSPRSDDVIAELPTRAGNDDNFQMSSVIETSSENSASNDGEVSSRNGKPRESPMHCDANDAQVTNDDAGAPDEEGSFSDNGDDTDDSDSRRKRGILALCRAVRAAGGLRGVGLSPVESRQVSREVRPTFRSKCGAVIRENSPSSHELDAHSTPFVMHTSKDEAANVTCWSPPSSIDGRNDPTVGRGQPVRQSNKLDAAGDVMLARMGVSADNGVGAPGSQRCGDSSLGGKVGRHRSRSRFGSGGVGSGGEVCTTAAKTGGGSDGGQAQARKVGIRMSETCGTGRSSVHFSPQIAPTRRAEALPLKTAVRFSEGTAEPRDELDINLYSGHLERTGGRTAGEAGVRARWSEYRLQRATEGGGRGEGRQACNRWAFAVESRKESGLSSWPIRADVCSRFGRGKGEGVLSVKSGIFVKT